MSPEAIVRIVCAKLESDNSLQASLIEKFRDRFEVEVMKKSSKLPFAKLVRRLSSGSAREVNSELRNLLDLAIDSINEKAVNDFENSRRIKITLLGLGLLITVTAFFYLIFWGFSFKKVVNESNNVADESTLVINELSDAKQRIEDLESNILNSQLEITTLREALDAAKNSHLDEIELSRQ